MIDDNQKFHLNNLEDHNLLIRVDENVKNLITEVKDMRDGSTVKLADHETRIRTLETSTTKTSTQFKTWGAIATLVLGSLEFFLRLFMK